MIFLFLTVLIFSIDLSIKFYVNRTMKLREEKKLFKGKIILTHVHNHGMIMNRMEGQKKKILLFSSVSFAVVCLLFIIILPKKRMYLWKLALSFLVGGGASNLYNRAKDGYVTDYFSFSGRIPKKLAGIVFNLGDIFIFLGSFLLIGISHK